ncbi:ankyrin repeat domain-containing protein [Flavivirga jejuensis]|uniref:Ankyrin repeat domain-containing protein n=1 Tax=Flavivirga jejuensis TaxID=870487 RepID=A0ABT8WIK7_9FLAO|nr:ankyrin repeat domain-containing protein [Flavivirga jejuensis]MDO5972792.1 ankyrin repeat domain-containing protein [Flavivirga jejuensis]
MDKSKQLLQAFMQNNLKQINMLLKNGADINELYEGSNCLHHACTLNKKDMVEFLLKEGADPNVRDSDNRSPLFLYMYNYNGETPNETNLSVFKLLIKYGADIFKLFNDNEFDTLRIAITLLGNHRTDGWVSHQNYDNVAVKYKLTKGAMHYIKPYDESKRDAWGKMVPIKDQKNITSMELGLSEHANYLRLYDLIMYILDKNVMDIINTRDLSKEYMPSACELGVGSIIKKLYEKGADFSFKQQENGMTALLSICLGGRVDGLRTFFQLMPKGYDINETNDHGYNAAHILADKGGHPKMVDELRKYGVDFSSKTTKVLGDVPKGSTPSDVAKHWNDYDMANLLKP